MMPARIDVDLNLAALTSIKISLFYPVQIHKYGSSGDRNGRRGGPFDPENIFMILGPVFDSYEKKMTAGFSSQSSLSQTKQISFHFMLQVFVECVPNSVGLGSTMHIHVVIRMFSYVFSYVFIYTKRVSAFQKYFMFVFRYALLNGIRDGMT